MVLNKHGDFLYSHLTRLQSDHLQTVAEQINTADAPAFLSEIQRQWAWFELSLAHVRDVLMYMDRHYVKTRNRKTVYELGISLFREVVITDSNIRPHLSSTLFANIERERNGETIDMPLMRSITSMLAQLGENEAEKSVYEEVFEDMFLERTKQFYAREATLYLSECTCSDYLHRAAQRMTEERLRVEAYLEPRTADKVRMVTERELISKYMTKLMDMENSGLISMLRNDKVVDLRLMYTLFREIVNGEEMLRNAVKKEVLERGNEIMGNVEFSGDAVALIDAVLMLKEKYEAISNTAFTLPILGSGSGTGNGGVGIGAGAGPGGGSAGDGIVGATSLGGGDGNGGVGTSSQRGPLLASVAAGNTISSSSSSAASATGSGCCATGGGGDGNGSMVSFGPADKKFVTTINEGFERFFNGFPDSAEYASLYVDKLLRRDFKGNCDDEVEAKLDGVMTLFRLIHDKDAFQRYYQLHLTKRLLHGKAANSDAERSFIAKMKMDCGYMFTSKMEVMFNDIKTSEETSAAFKEQDGNNVDGIDVNVSVLTTMSWPINQSPKVNLPTQALCCINRFERFYYSKHEGRRLSWQSDLGTADIRAYFGNQCDGNGSGSRWIDFISVPALSMCILMLFNQRDEWTYEAIAKATQIGDAELTRHLQSLSLAKYRVLKKHPMEREVKATDVFKVNEEFSSRNRRLKLQVISARKENEREKSATKSKIDDDRRPVIDTVIVRIMKHRKVLDHNKLIVEVTHMLSSRFEPNPQDIKKRIESLVEREFLERQQDKRQIYQYVA